MSVQAGIWHFDGRPAERDFLETISRAFAKYGPDGEAVCVQGPVGMVYRALHTTPESRLERQPHVCPTGIIVTWDGRLDNRDELFLELHNEILSDKTDLSLVRAAFERWGRDCFAKFIGDWAASIWDPRSQELLLARDYAGVRHLFYYAKPKSVTWCTYLEPLALCGDNFTLCDEYLAGYLAMYPKGHLTPYNEIRSVPPGHFVSFRHGHFGAHRFWAFNPRVTTRYNTDAEYEEHFRHLFRQAVRQRLRSDSPVLADLSGGLDSSSIVCMADDILAKETIDTPAFDTFSVLLFDEPGDEDVTYIKRLQEQRGCVGHCVELREGGDIFSFDNSSFVATPGLDGRSDFHLAKAAVIEKGGYRVLLSGFGGDELLGQTQDPVELVADALHGLHVRDTVKQLRVWSLLLRRPWLHLLYEACLMQVARNTSTTGMTMLDPWVNPAFAKKQRLSALQAAQEEGSLTWLPTVRSSFNTVLGLARARTQAKPSTEETRYPYLDQRLVEFLISIPAEQLLRPGQRRSLMRRALAGFLPAELLVRKTKSFGGRSMSISIDKHWDRLEDILKSPLIAQLGYVKKEEFRNSLLDVKSGKLPRYFLRSLKALFLELWLREAIAQGVIALQPGCPALIGTEVAQQTFSA
jgi:asparagine synthase (glutamine-hydrolysing)